MPKVSQTRDLKGKNKRKPELTRFQVFVIINCLPREYYDVSI